DPLEAVARKRELKLPAGLAQRRVRQREQQEVRSIVARKREEAGSALRRHGWLHCGRRSRAVRVRACAGGGGRLRTPPPRRARASARPGCACEAHPRTRWREW